MAFSLSGSTVTQTGTDADLSGLSAITGVVTTTLGEQTIYDVPYFFIINGDMTQQYKEQLIVGTYTSAYNGNIPIRVEGASAIWRWGETYNKFGVDTYRRTLPLFIKAKESNAFDKRGIQVSAGGTLDWKNVEAISGSSSVWANNANLIFRDVTINRQNLNEGGAVDDAQMRIENFTNVDIDGLHLIGGKLFIKEINIIQFKNYKPEQMTRGLGCSSNPQTIPMSHGATVSTLAVGSLIELPDYLGVGNQLDYGAYSDGYVRFINPESGSDLKVGGHNPGSNASDGWAEARGSVEVSTELSNGTPLDDVKIYLEDNNTSASAPFTDKIIYSEVSSGGVANIDILLGFVRLDNATDTSHQLIKRSANQIDDIYSFKAISYLHNISTFNVDFKGVGEKVATALMSPDSLVTEPDKTLVAAYTELDTAPKILDWLKLYWRNNYINDDVLYATRDGSYAYIKHEWSLVFTGDLGAPVGAVDEVLKVITVRATNVTSNDINTAVATGGGTITAIDGAIIDPSLFISDANGDSALRFVVIESWKVFATEVDRDNNTNPVATGLGNELHRFTFAGAQTFWLKVISGGTSFDIREDITEAGLTEISLSSEAQLVAANEKLDKLKIDLEETKTYASRAGSQRLS